MRERERARTQTPYFTIKNFILTKDTMSYSERERERERENERTNFLLTRVKE